MITGGAGFVLSHLARAWVATEPANRALIIDTGPFDPETTVFLAHSRIECRQASVTDPAVWGRLSGADPVRYIVHGAAVTSIRARGRFCWR